MFRVSVLSGVLVCYSLVAQAPMTAPAAAPAPAAPAVSPAVAPAAQAGARKLTLQEAIQVSLKNNLQVGIAEETRSYARGGAEGALGAFDWNLGASLQVGHQMADNSAGWNGTGSKPEVADNRRDLQVSLLKPFEWGGTFQLKYEPLYQTETGTGVSTSPYGIYSISTPRPYTGALSGTYTQSLLRNFGRDVTAAPLLVARKGEIAADYQFQKAIIALVATTETEYWDVVYGQRNLENARVALALAQKQLKENQIRVEVGTLAPIEVTSAEASVAQQEQNIIAAEALYLNAKDALMRSLYPNNERPTDIEPTDAPTLGHTMLGEAEATRMALQRRVELLGAQNSVETNRILTNAAVNRLKPQLDAFATYSGGTGNYSGVGTVNTDLLKAKYPGYQVGLTFGLPLGNHAAKGALSQQRANLRSSELGLQDLQLQIGLEVRTAIRNVEASEKGIRAAEKTRIYRERNLEAEQKKYDNGMSTNFLVLQRQDELDSARSAELQAQIAYAKAVTALETSMGNLLQARNLRVK
jgi:outer membrane protein